MAVETQRVEDFKLEKEPYYLPVGNEIELYEAAYQAGLPVMLKGPTGCGKTRFVEHMSWRLKRTLITVACHEDLTASDLVGDLIAQTPQGKVLESKFKGLSDIALLEAKTQGCTYADIRFTRNTNSGVNATGGNRDFDDFGGGFGGRGGGRGGRGAGRRASRA